MRLNEVENYDQLQQILEESSWQRFEKIVGKIFELNEYKTTVSKIVSFENTKRQYDILAEKSYYIAADCKKWNNKRRIKYGLQKAVKDQIERVKKLKLEKKCYPILVLSCTSPIKLYKKIPIVPIFKLGKFLSKFSSYKDKILEI